MDAKIIAATHGLQASGIVLFLANGSDLARCRCSIDLALSDTRERFGSIDQDRGRMSPILGRRRTRVVSAK